MEKEISQIYTFDSKSFGKNGETMDGMSFRDLLKEFEYDFHEMHTAYYALNMYANSNTMRLLQAACKADVFLSYGMDLLKGDTFDPIADSYANHEMAKYSTSIIVYAIDSAYMNPLSKEWGIDEQQGIYPLTLLIDDSMSDGILRLSTPCFDDGDETEKEPVNVLDFEYA